MRHFKEKTLTADKGDTNSPEEIKGSGDGSYRTRGHSSLHGVVTLVGHKTGKILDTEVVSKHCKACEYWDNHLQDNPEAYLDWLEVHQYEGLARHEGSSGSMECKGMVEIFRRAAQRNMD